MTLTSMAMEKHCTLENFRVSGVDADACTDWSLHRSCSGESKESDNPDVEVLENLEDYFQDLNDRLIISRMVSDSVIKGMVGAVEQEAKEKIAQKELEISWLRSALRCYRNEKNDHLFLDIPETRGLSQVFSNDVFDVRDFIGSSLDEVMEQVDNLRKEIDGVTSPDSFWNISSDSQLVGIDGLLSEKESDRWTIVDNMVNNLKNKLESTFHNLVNLDVYSKGSIHELQQEQRFRAEVEASVLAKCIRGYQDESDRKLWGCGNRPNGFVSTSKKIEEFRALQEELDALSKLLSVNDAGKLVTHGSQEAGEAFMVSSSDQNGMHDELVITMPESLDPAQLKHLPKDQLINYFKDEMIKMKRNHETKVHQMTEEVFSLKREYLKEKRFPLTLRKEKELDGLRRKIPEVMSKLEGILTEEKCVPDSYDGSEFVGILKERLEALQSENENLRNVVSLKRKEVKYLKPQVSDPVNQLSSLSCVETNLLHAMRGLKSDGEDAQIEASIREDVYLSYLGDLSFTLGALNNQTSDRQKTDVGQSICPSECEEAPFLAKSTNQWEIDHSEIASIILQGVVHEVVFTACLKDAEENMNYLNNELAKEVMYRITFESEGMEKDNLVRQGVLENEKLREEKTKLATFLVQKERLAEEAMGALSSWEDQLQLLVININHMFDMISQLDQRVTSEIRINSSRLVSLVSGVSPLSEKFKMLRTVVLGYKHRLETRTSNLEKAEAEVDLLGDQVDSLLRLLEKVYIALDHYSPILKHYPGIMEILKLVRKELCGESFKSVDVDLDDTPK